MDNERYIKQAIGKKILEAMENKGFTHQDLASRMGTKSANVTLWTSGYHNFTVKTLITIGNILEITFFNL